MHLAHQFGQIGAWECARVSSILMSINQKEKNNENRCMDALEIIVSLSTTTNDSAVTNWVQSKRFIDHRILSWRHFWLFSVNEAISVSLLNTCQNAIALDHWSHQWCRPTFSLVQGIQQETSFVFIGSSIHKMLNAKSLQELFRLHRKAGSGRRPKTTSRADRFTLLFRRPIPLTHAKCLLIRLTFRH